MSELFKNRREAGKKLAEILNKYIVADNTYILALPRGGVPVAYEIAIRLRLPLDIMLVRKLGYPSNEEYAIGAIAGDESYIINPGIQNEINQETLEEIVSKELRELKRRNQAYRGNKPMPNLKQKNVILVDDGIATGYTMQAAVIALKKMEPQSIIVAVPVIAADTLVWLRRLVAKLIYLKSAEEFVCVGSWYKEFPQVSDEEVIQLLKACD